jgi:hypothetical protein
MAKMLKTHYLIAGVGIESLKGRLKTGSNAIRHWVVVERITPAGKQYQNKYFGGNRGWVELYNPFMNVIEEYSYREFTTSMHETGADWYGLWVKRDVQPVFAPQETLFPNIEVPENKVGKKKETKVNTAWPEKKLRDQIEKMLGKDKPVKDIPALLSKRSGWSMEAIARMLPVKETDEDKPDTIIPIVRDELGVESLPSEIEHWLSNKSHGNSSLAIALAHALRESEVLAVENKKGRITNPEAKRSRTAKKPEILGTALSQPPTVASVIGPIFAAKAL